MDMNVGGIKKDEWSRFVRSIKTKKNNEGELKLHPEILKKNFEVKHIRKIVVLKTAPFSFTIYFFRVVFNLV